MRVNAINQYRMNKINDFNNNCSSFDRTAVPYPEYEYAYYQQKQEDLLSYIADKLSNLFNPRIDKESQMIKENIDALCDNLSSFEFFA